jgi:hypothetical protein
MTSSPASYDLTLYAGTTPDPITLLLQDAVGVPLDLSGWTAFAQGRPAPGREPVHVFAAEIPDGNDGRIVLDMTTTEDARHGHYHWDLILRRPDESYTPPLLQGRLEVRATITDPAHV